MIMYCPFLIKHFYCCLVGNQDHIIGLEQTDDVLSTGQNH